MASKVWAVVLFEDENSVATVPNTWLFKIDSEDVSYWPTNSKNITNKVKRREEPEEHWPKFKCKILGSYDKYETALKKSLTAEDNIELNTSASEENHRRRKINKKYWSSSSSSSSNSESNEMSLNKIKYPKCPHKTTKLVNEEDGEGSDVDTENRDLFEKKPVDYNTKLTINTPLRSASLRQNHTETTPFSPIDYNTKLRLNTPSRSEAQEQSQTGTSPFSPINTKVRLNTPSRSEAQGQSQTGTSPFSPINTKVRLNTPSRSEAQVQSQTEASQFTPTSSDLDFKRQVFNKLNIITAKLAHHDECFESIRSLLETQNPHNPEVLGDSCDYLLPLEDDEALQNVNDILNNKENFKRLVKELSLIGGNSPEELTKKIMYRVITSEFAQLYSWEGGKGKRKFCHLSLSKVIFEAVRLNKRTSNACEDQIINSIKKFLVKAKERVKNKQKRKNANPDQNLDIEEN